MCLTKGNKYPINSLFSLILRLCGVRRSTCDYFHWEETHLQFSFNLNPDQPFDDLLSVGIWAHSYKGWAPLEYDMAQNRPKLQFCMCGSRGGIWGPDPPPLENHKLYVFYVRPPLDPWKSIFFSVIKTIGPPL